MSGARGAGVRYDIPEEQTALDPYVPAVGSCR